MTVSSLGLGPDQSEVYQPTITNGRDIYRVEVRVEGRGRRALARRYR
jgi:hypothetical protein